MKSVKKEEEYHQIYCPHCKLDTVSLKKHHTTPPNFCCRCGGNLWDDKDPRIKIPPDLLQKAIENLAKLDFAISSMSRESYSEQTVIRGQILSLLRSTRSIVCSGEDIGHDEIFNAFRCVAGMSDMEMEHDGRVD